jgi:N-acetylneuraminate lyase
MKSEKLCGIMPAFLTAYTDDGEALDTARVKKHAKYLADFGVHGLYVGGSTGEMVLCSVEERKALLEAVLEETAGRCTVIAHVGCTGTRETLELARHAAKAGADAVSSVTPFYYAYRFPEVKRFYEEIADAAGIPVIIYNIPARTGMTLNAAQLHELLSIPGIAGMKFTSSDFFLLERLRTEHPEHVFYNGSDEMLLSGLAAGADGGIGSTYNLMPDVYLSIYRNFRAGRIREAQADQSTANRVVEALIRYGAIGACKALLREAGHDCGFCRRPFLPPDEDAMRDLRANAADVLAAWRRSR